MIAVDVHITSVEAGLAHSLWINKRMRVETPTQPRNTPDATYL